MHVGTQAIRTLFAGEKPPVPEAEWDEAAYVGQRLAAYRDALDALASVVPMPGASAEVLAGHEKFAASPPGALQLSCARTGDCAIVDLGGPDGAAREQLRSRVEVALQRVFADAHAWRRCLTHAYFERHRSWRAVAGAPIQH